jgi:hypothetical protein
MASVGLEPHQKNQAKAPNRENGAPPRAPFEPVPADLASVVAAWPKLPAAVRAGIVAMVKASNP